MNFLAWARAWRQPRPRPDTTAPAATALAPHVVRRGLRLSIVEGALANVHINLTMGVFLTGFALLLGAGDFELGLLGALALVGQLFQFVGAYLEERLGERKHLTILTAVVSRSLWALVALLPFVTRPGPGRLVIFMLILVVAQALIGITTNAWISWMSDLVPPRERGSFFGIRNTVNSISAMLSGWLAGYTLDYFGGSAVGYALIFGCAVLCSLVAAVIMQFQPEPPKRRQDNLRIKALFSAPLRHPPFRTFSLAAAGWALVTGVAAPFFNAYGIQDLKLSFASLALMGVVTSAVALVFQPLIGRLQDRYGDRQVLIYSVVGVIALPWGWVLSTPTFLLPLWVTTVLSGVFWPGINQGLINLLMDRAPTEGRGAYVASYGAITGVGSFVASLLGGILASALGTMLIHVGPLTLNHYAILFALSSVGRAVMVVVFVRRL